MSRPNPNSETDAGTDRPTTPGLGDDPRATLPEPLPPVRVPAEFSRTIPMGSSALTEWMANSKRPNPEHTSAGQSGIHSLGPDPSAPEPTHANPVTKSDRVLAKGRTLHSFGAAAPPTIETEDKRWIGQEVAPTFNTTQRGFSSIPPSSLPPSSLPPNKQTLPSIAPPQHRVDLASTVRVMSVPPPAESVPPPAPSRVPPPIIPSPTIKVSPEIAIGARTAEVPRANSRAVAIETTPETAIPPQVASVTSLPLQLPEPLATPLMPAAPSNTGTRWNKVRDQVGDWSTARLLTVALLVALAAIAVLILSTTPSSSPTPATVVLNGEVVPAVAQLPTTELVTNPPGAEIILRGALVANSPARVVRPSYESLYLVRLRGYQPQLVALAPHSPDQIRLDLQPLAGSQPTLSGVQPATQSATQPATATNTLETP